MSGRPLNLNEPFELAGDWWLSDNPENQVSGILRYDGEGSISLSLIGGFEDRITSNPAPGVTAIHSGSVLWEAIHGLVERQRKVTLLDCFSSKSRRIETISGSAIHQQAVAAMIAVIGAHIDGKDDSKFVKAEVSVENLGVWAASSALESFIGAEGGKLNGFRSISVKPVEKQTVKVNDVEYSLVQAHTLPHVDRLAGEAIGLMRDTSTFCVSRAQPFTLEVALEDARSVQDLIALATNSEAGLIWLQLEIPGIDSVSENGRQEQGNRASVFYAPAAIGKRDKKAVDINNVFFTCRHLPFSEILPRWCEVRNQLQTAINMILGLRYAPPRFIENALLVVVCAAEVLHRNLYSDKPPLDKVEFERMREAMLSQVPEEHYDRFKSAIRNVPTLRDRLRDLASRLDAQVGEQIVPDIEYWSKRTSNARNELAHRGFTASHSLEELSIIVRSTTMLVLFNILLELGLHAEKQLQILKLHPQLWTVSREAQDLLRPPSPES